MGRNLTLIALGFFAIVVVALGLNGSYALVWAQLKSLGRGSSTANPAAATAAQLQKQVNALQHQALQGTSHGS